MNEAETLAELIDPLLTAAYVLSYRNTQLAVVEAKADGLPLTEGVGQAKEYAAKLQLRFTYASNGKGIYAIDMDSGEEGETEAFPTPQDPLGSSSRKA